MASIHFHFEDVPSKLSDRTALKSWIKSTIALEGKNLGTINFIFGSDEFLLEMNRQYLQHDYYTDVITFDYCENSIISGDIFISLDRIKDNSISLSNNTIDELHRVIIHGVLHLCGYKDKSEKDEKLMREKENYYLQKRDF